MTLRRTGAQAVAAMTPNLDISMTTEIDIYRSAHVLIKRYGEDAAIEAALRADAISQAIALKLTCHEIQIPPAGSASAA